MKRKVAIYARVSTDGQTTDNQVLELKSVLSKCGWDLVDSYIDEGISGSKGRDKRPELDRMLKDAVRRKFDVVMAWSVDRLGRSLQDLISLLNELHSMNIDLYLHQQGIDTTTPAGKAMFQMLGVFAEFERSMIQERVKAGLARAVAQGKTLGRPKVPESKIKAIKKKHKEGLSIRKIAKEVKVGHGVIQRVIKEMTVGV